MRLFSSSSSSTPPVPSSSAAPLTETDFDALANDALSSLETALSSGLEDLVETVDVSTAQGVLTLNFGDERGAYVLNKQGPNKQIWWSSPISGPRRYAWDGATWRSTRDGHRLVESLQEELRTLTGATIQLPGSL